MKKHTSNYPLFSGTRKHNKLLLIMKMSIFLTLFCVLNTTAAIYSENTLLSLNLNEVTVRNALKEIETNSEYRFFYNDDYASLNNKVNLNVKEEKVSNVLGEIFAHENLSYKIMDNNVVVISPTSELQQKVTGTVTDAYLGTPLPGVNIIIDGATTGVITDLDGKYSINVPSADSRLIFSYIGYIIDTVNVNGQSVIDIQLIPDIQALDEVVVIGYGTTDLKNFTGSITKVKMKDSPLSQMTNTNLMESLRGTVPGMTVSQQQGEGQNPSLLIRGQKSISGGNDPLIVLDGVIFMGSMRAIDPTTIESISVLKDATSIAAYGSRAANGVVMINTKKGDIGKPIITFRSSFGISKVINQADVLSPEKWVEKVNLLQGLEADADPSSWISEFELENYKSGKTINWQDFIERTGSTQNYSLGISGGSKKMNYYVSGSYTGTEGVLIGDDYKRTAFSSRLTYDITDWLEIGNNVNYSFNDYSGPTTYNIYQAIRLSPYGRVYREEDNSLLEKYPAFAGIFRINPLWSIQSGTIDDHDVYHSTILNGHALIKAPWIKGLSYRLNYSYTNKLAERDYFTHEEYYVAEGTTENRYADETISGYLAKANGYSARTKDIAWVFDNIINYKRSFGKHLVDITGVYTRDSYDYNYKKITGEDFSELGNSELGYNGLTYAATQKISSFYNTLKNNIGYLGRINYNYDSKYHLTTSIRRDGASVFGKNNKWGLFPSVGAAWTVSEESFLKGFKPINYLKVKFSWGINGNQSLNPYRTLSPLSLGQSGGYSYPFGNTSEVAWGQRISSLGNSDLKWEETTAINYGFEIALLNFRINLGMDGYLSKTKDQIFKRNISVMPNGFESTDATMGQVNNYGIEATLTTENIKHKDFSWNSTVTFYMNRNKLIELYGDGKDDISNNLFLNKSLGAIYGYKTDGIVQEDDLDYINKNGAVPGDVKFLDQDGNDTINSEDRTILGYSKENFQMSFANTFQYKNLELYLLFTGIFGGGDYYKKANIFAYRTASDVGADNNFNHGWWTPENKSNKYPRIGYTDSRYTPIQDRTFVRLQNVSLAYRFNQQWVKKLNISNIKVYASATNLFTITGWEGGDPETGQTLGSGYSYGYPLSSIYSFGIDLTF